MENPAYEVIAVSNAGRDLSPEVLGEAHGKLYPQLEAAHVAAELQSSVAAFGLDPSTVYTAEKTNDELCVSCLNDAEYTRATRLGDHPDWAATWLCDECNAAYQPSVQDAN